MSDPTTPDTRPVHFVGIAGAGMSALAELYLRRGYAVTGCDTTTVASADLERLGVHVMHGHDASHVAGVANPQRIGRDGPHEVYKIPFDEGTPV